MRGRVQFGLGAAALAVGLAGCGGGGDSQPQDDKGIDWIVSAYTLDSATQDRITTSARFRGSNLPAIIGVELWGKPPGATAFGRDPNTYFYGPTDTVAFMFGAPRDASNAVITGTYLRRLCFTIASTTYCTGDATITVK